MADNNNSVNDIQTLLAEYKDHIAVLNKMDPEYYKLFPGHIDFWAKAKIFEMNGLLYEVLVKLDSLYVVRQKQMASNRKNLAAIFPYFNNNDNLPDNFIHLCGQYRGSRDALTATEKMITDFIKKYVEVWPDLGFLLEAIKHKRS